MTQNTNSNEMTFNELTETLGVRQIASVNRDRSILPTSQREKYSISDLEALLKRIAVPQNSEKAHRRDSQSVQSLIQYFRPIHEKIGSIKRDFDRFKEMGPEIGEAAEILTSSIISPNDLQEGNPYIEIVHAEKHFNEDVYNKIIAYLENYFYNEYRIGKKLKNWILEAMFKSGAKVLLTIPERTLYDLIKDDPERRKVEQKNNTATESLKNYNKNLLDRQYHTKSIKEKQQEEYLRLAKSRNITGEFKGLESQIKEAYKNELEELKREMKSGFESMAIDLHSAWKTEAKNNMTEKEVLKGLESFAVKFVTELNEGDTLHISENPSILKFGKTSKKKAKKDILNSVYLNLLEKEEQTGFISLLNHMAYDKTSEGHPLQMEIPTEAVIPICIPGSVEERLGYFILIDDYGYPLEASSCLCESGCTNDAAINAFRAMYKNESSYSNSFAERITFAGGLKDSGMQQFDFKKSAVINVFDHVLNTMLKNRLKNMGLGAIDLGQTNVISACMLKRFFENKKTCLVFVPEEFLTYIAFDYRPDGTGKTLIEGMRTLLSIRATLMVASMMSAVNAAIPYVTYDISFDEKDYDWEQSLSTAMEMIVSKANGGLNLGVADIQTGIIDSHFRFNPKGMPGIENFEMNKSTEQHDAIRVDDNVLDLLNKLINTHLIVPPSALNQLSETEFSRSVATTNIYYANKISVFQDILESHLSKHGSQILQHDPLLLNGLKEIIKGSLSAEVHQKPTSVERKEDETQRQNNEVLMSNVENNVINIDKGEENYDIIRKILFIIENFKMSLPSPNVAADKTQYEEAANIMNLINGYIDGLYNPDMFTNDSELRDTFTTMITFLKSEIYNSVSTKLGIIGTFDLPTLQDLIIKDNKIVETYRLVRNIGEMLKQDKTLQTTNPPETDNTIVNEGEDTSTDIDTTENDSESNNWNF